MTDNMRMRRFFLISLMSLTSVSWASDSNHSQGPIQKVQEFFKNMFGSGEKGASNHPDADSKGPIGSDVSADPKVLDFLQDIFKDNHEIVSESDQSSWQSIQDHQTPRATVLMCADSRVHVTAFDKTPVNDLFLVRNIGNQIANAEGSIEYGIYHLKTPVLLIIGHTHCGAIKAFLGDWRQESKPIQKELGHLKVKAKEVNSGAVENVHLQVQQACNKFKNLIHRKELIVVGTVYDFRNDFQKGHGRLILVNVNQEKDPEKLKQVPFVQQLKDIIVGTQTTPSS